MQSVGVKGSRRGGGFHLDCSYPAGAIFKHDIHFLAGCSAPVEELRPGQRSRRTCLRTSVKMKFSRSESRTIWARMGVCWEEKVAAAAMRDRVRFGSTSLMED